MLVEGLDEIRMAIRAGYQPHLFVTAPELTSAPAPGAGTEILSVTSGIFKKIAYRENPDGWLAVFDAPDLALDQLKLPVTPLVIAMEGVEKPGNIGAILRTADAAGADAVLLCDGRASVRSPNVVRASRGTLFTVPVALVSTAEAIAFLRARGIKILAATPRARTQYTLEDLRGPLAIAVGAEDSGLTHAWLDQADAEVSIPMAGKVNSLNVSVAAALLLYEAVRQRQQGA